LNLLLVTLDQFRGDCLSAAGHRVARTPNLDRLAASGVRFDRHYSQAAPCSPGRACLYTGTYQMNNRVVANGTPLDDRLDNLARAGRRAGLDPTLFGYTDQGVDPRVVRSPDDPRLSSYEGVLPGFTVGLDLSGEHTSWIEWLRDLGYDVPSQGYGALATEPDRPEEVGVSAFLTNRYLDWLQRRDRPWFAHLSYLRPHPPYAAAGRWASAFSPDDVDMPLAPSPRRHWFHEAALGLAQAATPTDEGALRRMRAQYYGMVGDVDAQLGRIRDALERLGQWQDTFVMVTSDHGEQLGDHGLMEKLGYFEDHYRVAALPTICDLGQRILDRRMIRKAGLEEEENWYRLGGSHCRLGRLSQQDNQDKERRKPETGGARTMRSAIASPCHYHFHCIPAGRPQILPRIWNRPIVFTCLRTWRTCGADRWL